MAFPRVRELPAYLALTPPATRVLDAVWQSAVREQLHWLSNEFGEAAALQLRPVRALSLTVWQAVVAEAVAAGVMTWINAESGLVQALSARAMHLTHARLTETTRATVAAFQSQGGQVSAACHDAATLAHAEALGVDVVLVSPVLPTPSHPDAPVLGWAGFADLARRVNRPVYALGGLAPADLPLVRAQGGHGVAGISAFGGVIPAESRS